MITTALQGVFLRALRTAWGEILPQMPQGSTSGYTHSVLRRSSSNPFTSDLCALRATSTLSPQEVHAYSAASSAPVLPFTERKVRFAPHSAAALSHTSAMTPLALCSSSSPATSVTSKAPHISLR